MPGLNDEMSISLCCATALAASSTALYGSHFAAISTKSWCHRVSAVISGWNDVAIRLPCFTATMILSCGFASSFFFSSGSTYSASTSTPSPADRMAGARMKMARNGPLSSPGILHGRLVSNESICEPKKLRSTVTFSPPSSSCPPCFSPLLMRSARKMSPAHVPHTAPPLAWNARRGSNRFQRRAMLAIVVLSPPGMISPLHPASCSALRTSTASPPTRTTCAQCSAKDPCKASTPIRTFLTGASEPMVCVCVSGGFADLRKVVRALE
mmetsp:Transcript_14032/g.33622  ORF Transcript_14032/g.33622 Transcript_14032/m.33622 type:complete len:268 (+) Transcript_14032:1807-2610(+)